MLSPRDDDDDDSHLCIKCNATVVGLDNYVKHRKERCGKLQKNVSTKSDMPSIDSLDPTYSLGADVFFQSLELQSSVKKTSLARLTPPIPISKAVLDTKTTLAEASTSRDLPRMSPLTNLRDEDWIPEHSLRIGNNEDNQTKLINAVASISGNAKKEIPTSTYSITTYNDYKADVDFDESDDSEEDEEEEVHTNEKWKPPPNYTGGKWRPASPEHEEWDMIEGQEHTGGKWKPIMAEANERDDDYDAPPPGHTKGKWVPGHEKAQIMQTTIQNKGSVQYWCGPCNRRLGSRAIYEKHLMSSLHMRKVLPEHELEFSGHLDHIRPVDKRATRPSRFTNDTIYVPTKKKKPKTPKPKLNIKIEKKKRKRKPIFVHCSGCKSRVRLHLMGKHLISHYHFRKATDIKSEAYQQLILDNIDAIVHQSPFQCSPCKFYTNWLSNFMQHWYSEEHETKTAMLTGKFWCSFCKYECDTSQEMLQHMSGSDHSEVVAVINRSMPIIIRKKTNFKCESCNQGFRYNIELKRHSNRTGHKLPYTATDDYQELHKCQFCKDKFKSSITLAAHLKFKHKQKKFLCLVCEKKFSTSEDAKHHRFTLEHRIRKQEIIKEKGIPIKDLSRKCPYCTDTTILKNVLVLKEHIRTEHPSIKKSNCPKCGMSFIFSQEVTRHIKQNACQFPSTSSLTSSIVWNCSQCLFTTDSQAECYFHEALHGDVVKESKKIGEKETVVLKYECPLCEKSFRKQSLRQHLRQHTYERPFVCNICGTNFSRQSNLVSHSRSAHGQGILGKMEKPKKIVIPVVHSLKDTWKCEKCLKLFSNRSALSRHACDAAESCCREGPCVANTPGHLEVHRRSQGNKVKHHQCSLCPFKTDQASHMKRHLRCHEGTKPYCCPHCHFTCSSLENLRKHVLRSGLHAGLHLYLCRACAYQTDTAADLRKHLVADHGDQFDSKSAIQAVKLHLMKNNESDT